MSERSKEHASKACEANPSASSNLALSATDPEPLRLRVFVFVSAVAVVTSRHASVAGSWIAKQAEMVGVVSTVALYGGPTACRGSIGRNRATSPGAGCAALWQEPLAGAVSSEPDPPSYGGRLSSVFLAKLFVPPGGKHLSLG